MFEQLGGFAVRYCIDDVLVRDFAIVSDQHTINVLEFAIRRQHQPANAVVAAVLESLATRSDI